MANVFIQDSTMSAIGEAIREKTGGVALIYPKDMAAQISSIKTGAVLQEKTIAPTTSQQEVTPDAEYDGLSKVTVEAMQVSNTESPVIEVSDEGLIQASVQHNEGYVAADEKTTSTKQLPTQAAKAVTPSANEQVAVEAGVFTTGAVAVAGDANLVPENIKSGVSIFGVDGTHEGGGGGSDLVRYVTFLNEDGTTLYQMPVLVGDDCKDPVTHGDISTPTKESTAANNFTHSGWTSTVGGTADSSILQAITEDKTVYAAYTASVRYYTVTFYDDDNTTVLNTEQVAYGGSSSYEPDEKAGYFFVEWNPSPTNVVADMDCYATWQEGASFAAATWAEVVYACQNNLVPAAWKVGDSKEMVIGDYTYTIDIIGKGHDTYTDGGNAPLTFQLHDLYATKYAMNDSATLIGYGATLMHNTHLPSIKALMPTEVQAAIKAVDKKSVKAANNTTIETVSCELFLLSQIEIFGVGNSEGSLYEYYSNGGSKIKYLSGAATNWWLRPPFVHPSLLTCFSGVMPQGNYNGYTSTAAIGVSFAFCF